MMGLKITEHPIDNPDDPDDIRVQTKEIDYDADGNMTTIKQKIEDPDNPLVQEEMTLRHYRWDEEDRLRAVDLMPDNDPKIPEISNYTYDAAGERVVRYVPGRLEAFYSAHNAGGDDRLESFVYPSGLLTVKTLPLKPGTDLAPRMKLTTYTKHYYIGSERIASSLGRANDLGLFCKELQTYGMDNYLNEMDSKTAQAGEELNADYQYFEKALNLSSPILYNNAVPGCSLYPDSEKEYAVFWFHPDHLGSSSYISNLSGEISQHFEYFPFGETLVEEHKNSNNSPYKFNAKELDNETGNYYYGARYYNPKWSFWLSVDPLTEKYPGWSPYNYTLLNPVKLVDPDGRSVDMPDDWYWNIKNGNIEWVNGSEERKGYDKLVVGTNVVANDKAYQLQNDGRFVDLNTNKLYGKGDEIDLSSGNSIKSYGTWFEESQTWVGHNRKSLLNTSQKLQDSGDLVTGIGLGAAGVGSFVGGVGAAPGLSIAAIGNGIGLFGSSLELGAELMSADWSNASETGGFIIGGLGINLLVDRVIPGPTANISKESTDILKMTLKTVPARTAERVYKTSNDN